MGTENRRCSVAEKLRIEHIDNRSEGKTTLRQCQLVQLHLLHVFDAICRKLGLTYFLCGGSALGAARHKGFIPWDDDLDVGMPKADYRKFLKLAMEFLPESVEIQTPENSPRTARPFSKLRDRSSFYGECRCDVPSSDPSGIYIDIFVYEELPEIGYGAQKFFVKACASFWQRKRYFLNKCSEGIFRCLVSLPMAILSLVCYFIVKSVLRVLTALLPRKSTFMSVENGYVHRHSTADIYPLGMARFEDAEFPVPGNLDGFLTSQYGNWREIPPPDKRPRHAVLIDPLNPVK